MQTRAFGLAVTIAGLSASSNAIGAQSPESAAGPSSQAPSSAARVEDSGCAGERPAILAVVNGVSIPASAVESVLTDGCRMGVVGTPWFFVNGKVMADSSPAAMRAALDAALAASHR